MQLSDLVGLALSEDVGNGDVTTNSIIPADLCGQARIYAKQDLVVCGHNVASEVFSQLGARYIPQAEEGTSISYGTNIALVEGKYRALLTGERLALNFLMRLCGIATHTSSVLRASGSSFRIVDTRKTTPLLRALERRAVVIGGGANHRFALYDGILIKDNHIEVAGSITEAIARAKKHAHHLMKIEVEIERLDQLEEALGAGADVIMLDNMNNEDLAEAIRINQGRALLEASGNMTAQRIASMTGLKIDVISMGGLIHQATWADISMRISQA